MSKNRPNLVIAGVPKAGTTSLFRYLSEHPEVCASNVKEIRFFTRHHGHVDDAALKEYEQYFPATSGGRYLMEASPGYLFRAQDIAHVMRHYLPKETRLLFLLREPVERLFSFYSAQTSKVGSIRDTVSFDAYVRIALEGGDLAAIHQDSDLARQMVNRLYEGSYASSLREFLKFWPREQVFVGFVEDLKRDPLGFMQELCRFLELDPGFYGRYGFPIENQTHAPRFGQLHRMVHRLNRRLESHLNRFPAVRRVGRSAYNALLTRQSSIAAPASVDARRALRDFYAQPNEELLSLCSNELGVPVPDWLAGSNPVPQHGSPRRP